MSGGISFERLGGCDWSSTRIYCLQLGRLLVARTQSFGFFMTPEETVDIVARASEQSGAAVYAQLSRPGLVLVRIADVGQLSAHQSSRLMLSYVSYLP